MNKDINILVVTPTYNRVNTLPDLYLSLMCQTDKEFAWLIIDDGSDDETHDYIDSIKKEKSIEIRYIYQENGGKARALNKAFSLCGIDSAYLIVDSDDYLCENAIKTVKGYIERYNNIDNIGAFFFQYKIENGGKINQIVKKLHNDLIMNRYEYNKKFIQNDGCVCYLGKAVERYKYPEYRGEKYIGPTVIQLEMAREYKMVFSPEIIGVAEYQENGLTNQGRKLRMKNPLGMIHYSGLQQSRQSSFKSRIKNSIGAQAYRSLSGIDKVSLYELGLDKYLKLWALIPGWILKTYWRLKFIKEY